MTNELKKNTLNVILGLLILSIIEVIVFAFTPFFDYTAVTGTLLGFAGASLSFFFLALVVAKSVEKGNDGAGKFIQATYMLRILFMAVVIVIGLKLPYFNGYAVIIPFLLLRPTIMLANFIFNKKNSSQKSDFSDGSNEDTNSVQQ